MARIIKIIYDKNNYEEVNQNEKLFPFLFINKTNKTNDIKTVITFY